MAKQSVSHSSCSAENIFEFKKYSKPPLKQIVISFWQIHLTELKSVHKVLLALLLEIFVTSISAQSFVRLNSGTKENILKIAMFENGSGYFLTDKIYSRRGNDWSKMNLPSFRQITYISALAPDNIWYLADMENNTPILYHKHDSIIENIQLPFGVILSAMYFSPDGTGFFSSFSQVSVYKNRKFSQPILSTTGNGILKIFGYNENMFWILTDNSEFLKYDGKNFIRLLPKKKVIDFQMAKDSTAYLLCENEIIELHGNQSRIILTSEKLREVDRIFISPQRDFWMLGPRCKILSYKNDILNDFSYSGTGSLRDMSFVGRDEIWIAGSDGMLLYKGKMKFPPFVESKPGFLSFRLTNYGVDLDNEYGVALADFNGDGKTDIYSVCISDNNRLFINQLNNKSDPRAVRFFDEESYKRNGEGTSDEKTDLHAVELKLGITVADVDNDGDQDIYLCYLNTKNRLLLNDGSGQFRNVSNQPNRACENLKRCTAAAFADIDLDGFLDLFVTSENGSNKLFHNDGTGHFTDITSDAGVSSTKMGSCASFGDINNDGYPELCVTFWNEPNKLYLNESKNGIIKFRDITSSTDIGKSPITKSNGLAFVDVNNDGFNDLFITSRNAENKLYLNDGRGSLRDVTDEYFDKNIYLTNGAVFADFDLDGHKDLYITNVGENVMYKNINGLFFKDVTTEFGADLSGYGTGCAVGDLNNDGNSDLFAGNYIGGSSKVFLNLTENINSVTFKLEGTLSNRDAIGAKIYLYTRKEAESESVLAGFQEISGGSGYASISAKEAIFPLLQGNNYHAIVKFPYPGSEVKIDDIKPGVTFVREQVGVKALATRLKKSLLRAVDDPEILREFLKTAIVLFFFLLYYRKFMRGDDRIIWIRRISVFAIVIGALFLNWIFVYSSSLHIYLLPIAVFFIFLIIIHLVTERMQISQNIAKQRLQLREKISRDLHDDLASTLGSISIYSDTLKRLENPVQSETKKLSVKIAELTQSALQSITDIIWMTSPKNDSLQGLLAKTNNLLYETFTDVGIQYHSEINAPDKAIVLPDELKNDVFLILKEATHNIIRHARAKSVTLIADVNNNDCSITLMDDGIGFDERKLQQGISHGNGLVNIRRRAQESHIDISISSKESKGTAISLQFKI